MADTVRRATEEDVEFIESVINDPAVRPVMAPGDVPLAFTPTIEYALTYVSDHGVMFAENIGDNTFIALAAFKPSGRGLHAMIAMRESIRKALTETECRRLIGTIAMNPPNTKMLRAASILGFQPRGMMGSRMVIEIEYPSWALSDVDCHMLGNEFLDKNNIPREAEDMPGAIGAFLMTAHAGLVSKAVSEYELYATLSHTKPIVLADEANRFYIGGMDITEAVLEVIGE